ncbi:MAG TPA: TraB/GumN family protein [Pyrinomonadaceae bacterium]|nr:TraB/GumN family protein [Pyrinomonadaceae bacterium]
MKNEGSSILIKRFATAFLVVCASASAILAQNAAPAEESALLYKISGKNLAKPSYIFGTIHLICPKDMFPADVLKGYLNQTSQLILELDLSDPAIVAAIVKGSTLPDGKSVKDSMKPEQYAKIDTMFKSYLGISYDLVQTMKPSLVSAMLFRSPKVVGCQGATAYDTFLADAATAAKMPISGLETVEDELAAVDSQPLDKQIEDLVKVADDPEKTFNSFKELYSAYIKQDSKGLYKTTIVDGEMDKAMKTKLLTDRNAVWLPLIEQNISSRPTFIGMGAAHLGGDDGVLHLLKKKGYKITPIRL